MANPISSAYSSLPTYLGGRSRTVSPGANLKNLKSVKSKIDTSWKTKSPAKTVSGNMTPKIPGKTIANNLKNKFSGARSSEPQRNAQRHPDVLAIPPRPALKVIPPLPIAQPDGWRKEVRGFGAGDVAVVPKHPEFSREFLDKVLDSLPEDLVDELANSAWDFDGDGVADLRDFLGTGDGAPDVVDFLGLEADAKMIDFSGDDLIDFSGPDMPLDYTPDLIDFSEPGDSRIAGLFNEDAISDEEFELNELMAMANPEPVGRTETADAQMAAIAREAARVSRLIQNSPPEEMFLESETLPELPAAMRAMR